jgi:transcriptional regulator with XRE-family HTH domain
VSYSNAQTDQSSAQEADESRAQRWSKAFRQWVRQWQFADESGERALLNINVLAQFIGASVYAVTQWWTGQAFPSRRNATKVAIAFEIPPSEVYMAAGYMKHKLSQDYTQSLNDLVQAIQSIDGDEVERQRLINTLLTIMSSNWRAHRPTWFDLVKSVLESDKPPLAKAQLISSLVSVSFDEDNDSSLIPGKS